MKADNLKIWELSLLVPKAASKHLQAFFLGHPVYVLVLIAKEILWIFKNSSYFYHLSTAKLQRLLNWKSNFFRGLNLSYTMIYFKFTTRFMCWEY